MPSNEQRRAAAKRKLERQLARRAERARQRKRIGLIISVVAVVVIVGGVYLLVILGHNSSGANAANGTSTSAPVRTSGGPCGYATTPDEPAPSGKDVGLPTDPRPTSKTGTMTVTLKTNEGDIPITLDRAEAPCTVQSFEHLVRSKYLDNTPCHRMTAIASPPLKVLQCGDPTGTGTGGPGYTIPDEKPTNLRLVPRSTPPQPGVEQPVIYPRGTIAMANTGQPNSGGSQFFLVYADSQLPPDYTVFGTVEPAGLAVLDKIAAGGITPSTDPQTGLPSPDDGKPKNPVTIQQAVIPNT